MSTPMVNPRTALFRRVRRSVTATAGAGPLGAGRSRCAHRLRRGGLLGAAFGHRLGPAMAAAPARRRCPARRSACGGRAWSRARHGSSSGAARLASSTAIGRASVAGVRDRALGDRRRRPRRRPAGCEAPAAGWPPRRPGRRRRWRAARRTPGWGRRIAAITRHTGQTQHSALPVAKPAPERPPPSPRAASETAASAAATSRSASSRAGSGVTRATARPADSTRFLSSVSAVSMIIFSALRLNMPSMPIARSTASV